MAKYMMSVDEEDPYEVVKVLKTSDFESTEIVVPTDSPDTSRKLIRKRIRKDVGIGDAYETILKAQRSGMHFEHLPTIFDVSSRGAEMDVIMEYVVGDPLGSVDLNRPVADRLELFASICEAAQEMHEGFPAPLIHRDLKPENIIISNGNAILIDFGIAREFKQDKESDTRHFGTRNYAPPEQFGFGQTDARSDIYALGMILYYLMTGDAPNAQALSDGFRDVPDRDVRHAIKKATSFDPDLRYQSTESLLRWATKAMERRKPKRRAEESSHKGLSHWLGRTYNVAIYILWGIYALGCLIAAVEPSGSYAQYPLPFRVAISIICFFIPGTLLAIALLDKRRIKALNPLFTPSPIAKSVGLGIFAVLAFFATLFAFAAASLLFSVG